MVVKDKLDLLTIKEQLQDALDKSDEDMRVMVDRLINDINKELGQKYWDYKKGVYVDGLSE